MFKCRTLFYLPRIPTCSSTQHVYTCTTHTRVSIRHRFGQTMLLATLSTNSATATDGIDAEWKTLILRPWVKVHRQGKNRQFWVTRDYCRHMEPNTNPRDTNQPRDDTGFREEMQRRYGTRNMNQAGTMDDGTELNQGTSNTQGL